MSPSEPIFDEATLTLKVRLEAANPQRALKPGMFVDVEFPFDLPPALVVPADAIVDSGLRKTVFVDCGDGYFEPRLVETGWRIGDDVEVTKGLVAGERIVISGTFFVDSESRMKAAKAMIDRIIDFSVRNKFLVLLLVRRRARRRARACGSVPLDAIPDLGDTQVIVYSRWDRSPDIIEAQVTYPIVTAMLGAPHVQSRARRFRFRLLVRLRDLRGRHRHLLGAHADAGVPLRRPVAAAARFNGRNSGPTRPVSAGCSSTRSWIDRADTASPICGRTRTGTCATT